MTAAERDDILDRLHAALRNAERIAADEERGRSRYAAALGALEGAVRQIAIDVEMTKYTPRFGR